MGGSTVGRTVANDRVRQETRSSDNYRESLTTNACTHLPTHIFWVTHDYAVNYPLPSSCQKKVIIVIIIKKGFDRNILSARKEGLGVPNLSHCPTS